MKGEVLNKGDRELLLLAVQFETEHNVLNVSKPVQVPDGDWFAFVETDDPDQVYYDVVIYVTEEDKTIGVAVVYQAVSDNAKEEEEADAS